MKKALIVFVGFLFVAPSFATNFDAFETNIIEQAAQLRDHQPHPGPCMFRCVAVDKGWEEHWFGHRATNYTPNSAAQDAYWECKSYHGECRITQCKHT